MATEIETRIYNAVNALGVFAQVRFLVAPAESEQSPTALPIFVFSDGGRDYEAFRTFCGVDPDLYIQTINAVIIADTAAQARSLTKQVTTALAAIASLTDCTDTFDEELNGYLSEMTFTATP